MSSQSGALTSFLALAVVFAGGCSTGSRSSDPSYGGAASGGASSGSTSAPVSSGQTTTVSGSFGVGLAAQYPGDQNIGNDPSVLFATSFEGGIPSNMISRRNGIEVLNDPQIAQTGNACAKITATRGQDTGGDLRYEWANGVDQIFLRFYCRFDKDTVTPHHFVNVSGVTPNYAYRQGGAAGLLPPGGADGAFGTTIEPPNLDGIKAQYSNNLAWGFYTYWHEMRSWQTMHGQPDGRPNAYYGNNFRPPMRPFVGRENWICVEVMVKLNTIGNRDGEQAFWINGTLIEHYKPGSPAGTWVRDRFDTTTSTWNPNPQPFEGMSWRTHDSLQINRATLQWYVSDRAAQNGPTDKNIVYFDNVVVATQYIGPVQ